MEEKLSAGVTKPKEVSEKSAPVPLRPTRTLHEFTKGSTWAPLLWEAGVKQSEHLLTFIFTVSIHDEAWQKVRKAFTCITTQIKLHCRLSVAKYATARDLTISVASKYWEKKNQPGYKASIHLQNSQDNKRLTAFRHIGKTETAYTGTAAAVENQSRHCYLWGICLIAA
jgi:hypothetical protein